MSEERSTRGESNIDKVLRSIQSASLAELMSIWRSRSPEEGSGSPALFRCLGERILAQGEPLLAYDVVTAGLATWPKDVRLRQLQGLSLARSGATERANAILEELRRDVQTADETLGMLGRTYKDLAATAGSASQREEYLKRAAEIYGEAYQETRGYWSGINAKRPWRKVTEHCRLITCDRVAPATKTKRASDRPERAGERVPSLRPRLLA